MGLSDSLNTVVRRLARALHGWSDRVLREGGPESEVAVSGAGEGDESLPDEPPRAPVQHPESEPPASWPGARRQGPPSDWLDRVRRGAPHLLEPGAPMRAAQPAREESKPELEWLGSSDAEAPASAPEHQPAAESLERGYSGTRRRRSPPSRRRDDGRTPASTGSAPMSLERKVHEPKTEPRPDERPNHGRVVNDDPPDAPPTSIMPGGQGDRVHEIELPSTRRHPVPTYGAGRPARSAHVEAASFSTPEPPVHPVSSDPFPGGERRAAPASRPAAVFVPRARHPSGLPGATYPVSPSPSRRSATQPVVEELVSFPADRPVRGNGYAPLTGRSRPDNENRQPDTMDHPDRWPSLPEAPARNVDRGHGLMRSWQRLQRLESEQRGG